MNTEKGPGPPIYQEVSNLYQSESIKNLRNKFIELINLHNVPFADNILKTSDWVNYLYYCTLVHWFVPDQSALMIDWGGLYGHVTKILQTMGYENVFNYLLHQTPHYPFLEEKLKVPTLWGQDPNRLSLQSHSVDGFISSGVLEHVREDGIGHEETALQEIHRVLKKGGLFFIWNLPTKLGTSELLAMTTGKWHHQYRYWKKDVIQLLKKSGFEILYFDKHKFFPGAVINRLVKKIDPICLLKFDNHLSRLIPFNCFARDFVLVARRI